MMRLSLVLVFCFVALALANRDASNFRPFNTHGRLHTECLHEVPSGSEVTQLGKNKGFSVLHPTGEQHYIPSCKHGFLPEVVDGSGWQVYTVFNGTNKLKTYNGVWTVPAEPTTKSSQILYSFTGLQNSWDAAADGTVSDVDIIQPVLQFGTTPAGGGNYWALASWYVAEDGTAIFSTVLEVKVGDSIFGTMDEIKPSTWFISSNDTTSGKSTSITVKKANTKFEPWAVVTLEVYQVSSCDQYPSGATIPYTEIDIKSTVGTEKPQWTVGSIQKICQESIKVVSPDAVTISF